MMTSAKHSIIQSSWPQAALLAFVGLALFLPSLTHEFIYDDQWTIVRNEALDHPTPVRRFFLEADTAAYPPSGMARDVYRPISTWSFAVTKSLFGLRPAAFRFFNVWLHILNGLLLWLLLRRFVAPVVALIAAAFFLVHPLQVESVVWITQRSILMCGTGVLAALLLWEEARKRPHLAWGACLAFLFALFGKETALALPFVLFARLEGRRDRRFPALVACVFVGACYLMLRRSVTGHWGQPVQYDESTLSSLAGGMAALTHYVKSIFWPFHLNASYRPPTPLGVSTIGVWIGVLVLAGLLFSAVYFRRRSDPVHLGALIFLVFWLPHSGLTPLVTYAADRFMYLPLIGAAFALTALLSWRSCGIAGAVVVVGLAVQSGRRIADWRDEEALWAASVRQDGSNSFALACYAQALELKGDDTRADEFYRKALSNRPTVGLARSVITRLIRMNERRKDAGMTAFWRKTLETVPP